jgi:uncharacterized membrane protein
MPSSSAPEAHRDQPVFTARITPQRSLSPRGVAMVLLSVAAVSFCVSVPFVLLGAWPIAGFFGLDVLLVWLAFRIHQNSAKAYEDIELTPIRLTLRDVPVRGPVRLAEFNPDWVRLKRDVHAEFGIEKLSVEEGQRRVEIARYLGRSEKAEFAEALQAGLLKVRRGLRF